MGCGDFDVSLPALSSRESWEWAWGLGLFPGIKETMHMEYAAQRPEHRKCSRSAHCSIYNDYHHY